jgi:uncharacterized membrane protein YjfL (UPF0719 family)
MFFQQLLLGLLEFLLSILLCFVLVFGTYRLYLALTPKLDEERQLRNKNRSMGLFFGSILLGEAIVVKQAVYPVMAVVQIFITSGERGAAGFFRMLGLALGSIVLSGLLALFCMLFCLWLFNRLTPGLDLRGEIEKDNLAVAMMTGLLIVGISLLISEGVAGLTKALVPFPDVGTLPLG